MRRVFTLVGACLVMSLILASVAGAQETASQSSAAIAEGAPLPPAYVLERDGTVTIEGDVGTDCDGFLHIGFQETQERLEDEAQAVADKCRELGVPSGDLATGNSEVVLSLGTIGPPAPTSSGTLPDTGGLPLALLTGGLALVAGLSGLLLRRHRV